LAGPAAAASSGCTSLPGRSGLDQYCESLPGAGGGSGHHHHSGSSTGPKVSPKVKKELSKRGGNGAALLDLTKSAPQSPASTPSPAPAPAPAKKVEHHAKKKKHHSAAQHTTQPATPTTQPSQPASSGNIPSAPADNPVSAVASGVGGGSAFAWTLVALTVLVGASAVWTRRRRADRA
jgi:hypothetical protein